MRIRGLVLRLIRVVTMTAVLLGVVTAVAWFAARPTSPDAFYTHALPRDAAPGALIKSEAYTRDVPAGARGWRILYVTMRGQQRALASAIVVTQVRAGERPVVAWAHGTTGIVAGCAPAVLGKPFNNVPNLAAILGNGWAFVAPDYPGLGTTGGHAYLIGTDAAHAMLDAVRAARQLTDAHLSNQVVVWGHSQGGHAAIWSGMRAAAMAPELAVVGIAAIAPVSDITRVLSDTKTKLSGQIIAAYLAVAYARAYPDVVLRDVVGARSRIIVQDMATRCVEGYPVLFSELASKLLPAGGIFSRDPATGPLGARLAENMPTAPIPMPVLIAQGEVDDLILPAMQSHYVAARCAAGQKLDYRTYPARDHVSIVAADSALVADLMQWTHDRLAGRPAARDTCP